MKFPYLLSALFCLGWTTSTYAEERSLDDMRVAAQQALQHKGYARIRATEQTAQTDIQLLERHSQTTVLGYNDGGFAIISNDDHLPAVVAYCEGSYADAKGNPNFSNYLDTFNGYLDYCSSAGIEPRFIQRAATFNPEGVKEIMTCRWDQGGPYNDICPFVYKADDKGVYADNRCITGCVATAMSQIIYTLCTQQDPDGPTHDVCLRGAKFYNYTDDNKKGAFEGTYLASTPLDWNKMRPIYSGVIPYANRLAVARLMYACGLVAEMRYGAGASGTYTSIANDGINTFFQGLKAEYSGYGIESYEQRIYDELNAGRAILLSGADKDNNGHAFVGDGYDESGRLHINLGWSGGGNGFFTIADMAGYAKAQTVNFINFTDDTEFRLSKEVPLDELKGKYVTADFKHPAENILQDQWYVLYNHGRKSAAHSTGTGKTIQNTYYLPATDEADKVAGMLVRFIPKPNSTNAYYIQTGTGDYFGALTQGENSGSITTQTKHYTMGRIQQKKSQKYFYFKQNGLVLDCNAVGGKGIAGWGTMTPTDTLGNNSWSLFPIAVSETPDMPNFEKSTFAPDHRYVLVNYDGAKNYYFNLKATCNTSKSAATELHILPSGTGWKITSASDESLVLSMRNEDFKTGNGTTKGDAALTFFFEPTGETVDTGDEEVDACSRFYRIRCESGYLGPIKLALGGVVYGNLGPHAAYGRWLLIDQTDLDEIRADGIETVTLDQTDKGTSDTYDLQGRKVTRSAAGNHADTRGHANILIKEGRKVITH